MDLLRFPPDSQGVERNGPAGWAPAPTHSLPSLGDSAQVRQGLRVVLLPRVLGLLEETAVKPERGAFPGYYFGSCDGRAAPMALSFRMLAAAPPKFMAGIGWFSRRP